MTLLTEHHRDLLEIGLAEVEGANEIADIIDSKLELADLLDYRKYFNDDVSSNLYIDASEGNDLTGDGSSLKPFQSILRGYLAVPETNNQTIQLNLVGDGPYDFPTGSCGNNLITIKGSEEIVETRNIVSVISTTARQGIVFTIDGPILSNDEWRDEHLRVTGVLGDSKNIIVTRNIGNTIYGVMYDRDLISDIQSSPVDGQVSLLSFTQINLQLNPAINYSSNNFLNQFINCKILGSEDLFLKSGDLVRFWKCKFENLIISNSKCNTEIYSSSISNVGNTTNGCLYLSNNSFVTIGCSTVFSNRLSLASSCFINVLENSCLAFDGLVHFRGLDFPGIGVGGGKIINLGSLDINRGKTIFDNVTPDNDYGFTINYTKPSGGIYSVLPECVGSVSSQYFVTATRGAVVIIASNTSVSTSTTTNAVSANGGLSGGSINKIDFTMIYGGSPSNFGIYNYRPIYDDGTVPSTIYVTSSGNDTTGNGTITNPYLTIERAILDIPVQAKKNYTLSIGSGTFALPDIISDWNNIFIQGTRTVVETRNITLVNSSSTSAFHDFTVDGSTLTNDLWRGRLIRYVGGPANNQFGWVWINTANQLRSTSDYTTSFAAVNTSTDVELQSLDTTLTFNGTAGLSPVIKDCVQLNFFDCNITGSGQGKVIFFLNSPKVEFRRCLITNNLHQAALAISAYYCSYCRLTGSSVSGMLYSLTSGELRFQYGTVVDGLSSASNERYVKCNGLGAKVTFERGLAVREFNRFEFEGGNSEIRSASGLNDFIYHDDGSCVNSIVANALGEAVGGSRLSQYQVVSQLFYDETEPDESLRLFHRFPLAQRNIPIKLSCELCLVARYDSTGTRGKPLYYDRQNFPAEIKVDLDSGEDSIFKTSSDIRFFEEK